MAEYINRKDAINGFVQILKQSGDIYPTDITTMLQSIPPADVRPVVRGRWEPKTYYMINGTLMQDTDEWYGAVFVCDICGEEMLGASNFCPNCGADMREDREE